MLDSLRSAAGSWVAKVFLGLLLVSFALWGIPGVFHSRGSNTLISSGDSSISPQDYQYVLSDNIARASINAGRPLNSQQIKQFGLPQLAIARLHGNVLLDEEARLMKVGVSQEGILRILGQDPIFHNINGDFDKELFIGFTQQMQIPQKAIFTYLDGQARRDQILDATTEGIQTPNVFYSAMILYERELRTADYIKIEPSILGKIADPDTATLQAWFDKNKARYRAPEYRDITYIQMTTNDVTDPKAITTEALTTYYEANKHRFINPEKRVIEQLRFNTRKEADKAAAKLKSGTTFDALVKEQKQTLVGIRKGPLARNELPTLVASELFTLEKGAVSAVIDDLQGPVIARIVSIEPAGTTPPLEEIENELRTEIAKRDAVATLRANQKEIENSRFEGATLTEIAKQYKLNLVKVSVDAQGKKQDGTAQENLPAQDSLLQHAFESAAGIDTDPIGTGTSYIWYHVDKVTPSRDRTLDEVQAQVITDWKATETQRLLDEKAATLKKELDNKKSLADIAKAHGLKIEKASGISRTTTNEALGTEANAAIFAGPEGTSGMTYGPDNQSRILFTVTGVTEPLSTDPQSLPKQRQEELSLRVRQDLAEQFMQFARSEHPPLFNQTMMQQLLEQ